MIPAYLSLSQPGSVSLSVRTPQQLELAVPLCCGEVFFYSYLSRQKLQGLHGESIMYVKGLQKNI